MRNVRVFSLLGCVLLAIGLLSCAGQPTTTSTVQQPLVIEYRFSKGEQGWIADFADWPADATREFYELDSGIRDLPVELGQSEQGFMISGNNHSDDLFMYLRKKLTAQEGILPSTDYQVKIEVEFASNAFAGAIGIGGSPAESVYVKTGASTEEPLPVESHESGSPMLVLSVDKGQQSQDGSNAVVIGNVAKTDGSEDEKYALKTLSGEEMTLTATSHSDGSLWIFIGTDSAFEGITTLYYTRVKITLEKVTSNG